MGYSKIRLADGRELTIALDGKKVIEALLAVEDGEGAQFIRFSTPTQARVWVSSRHVTAVEDRPDLE